MSGLRPSRQPTLRREELKAIRRWPSAHAEEWSREMVGGFSALPGILAIVAVGSGVREVAESTDIDFIVVYDGRKPTVSNRPIDVDVRMFACDRLEELAAHGDDYVVWAIRLGAAVYERDGFWGRFRARWFGAAPWPSPVESEKRAERAGKYLAELLAVGDTEAATEQRMYMLTHLARAALLRAGQFPASRPELPAQLRQIAERELADDLELATARRAD